MRALLLLGLFAFAGCVPAAQGSVSSFPLEFSPQRGLELTAGGRWYVALEYDRQSWRARAVRLASGALVGRSLEALSPSERPAFGALVGGDEDLLSPFGRCSFALDSGPKPYGTLLIRAAQVPSGWQAGLLNSGITFRCLGSDRRALAVPAPGNPDAPESVVTVEFVSSLRVVLGVDVPRDAAPGAYLLGLELQDVRTGRSASEQLRVQVVPAGP